jgi:Xaa-Pro aminopeptidase
MILPFYLIDIFCTIQLGMLGNVTPNLRALYVEFENKTSFKLIFYYDITPTEDEMEFALSGLELKPGMVLTVEPGIYLPKIGRN